MLKLLAALLTENPSAVSVDKAKVTTFVGRILLENMQIAKETLELSDFIARWKGILPSEMENVDPDLTLLKVWRH